MQRSFALGGVFLVAAACGSTSSVTPSSGAQIGAAADASAEPKTTADGPSGLPCNVDTILAQNCRKCHSDPPQYGAPMPLLTWDDMQAPAPSDASKHVYEMAVQKVAADDKPMPPPPNARLNDSDRQVLKNWAATGAPKDPISCHTDTTTIDPTTGLSCTVNKTLEPAAAYEMPEDASDQYVCWGVDVTAPTPTHIVGFVPRTDNTTIVHHVVMYESPSSYPTTPQPCSAGVSVVWRMVLGWAPGVKGIELPPEAGFPIAATGTHYVVQMHYSNVQHLKGQKDASKIDLCTTAPRKYEADVLAFGTQNIKIPAAPPVGGVFTRDCSLTVPSTYAGIHLFTAMPHMHKLGASMSTTITKKAGGEAIDLGNTPNWDFNLQSWQKIDAVAEQGDVIRTRCSWKNNTGAEVKFGEKTSDEMCYSFTMYYPRIQAALWSWAAPSLDPPLGSTCKSEP